MCATKQLQLLTHLDSNEIRKLYFDINLVLIYRALNKDNKSMYCTVYPLPLTNIKLI